MWVQARFLGMIILDLASRVWVLGSGYRGWVQASGIRPWESAASLESGQAWVGVGLSF